eukprot:gene9312-9477_t
MAHSKDWKDRVEKMSVLAEVLTKQAEAAAPGEAYSELEKVLPKLLAAADDPHFKVSLAALAALQVCLNTAPHTLEATLDKLMPLLFLKLCGTKQSVRSAAEGALQACALRLDADSLLPALVRSLEAMKQPAARVSVMEFTVLFLGPGKVAGVPAATGQIRQWIGKNIPLLLDKNPNVRQMAGKALYTMLTIDSNSVAACLQHASAQEVMAVQRSLAESEVAHQADEQAAGGSSIVGLMEQAGLPSWATTRSTWGTGDRGTGSTCSSLDMSTASHGAAAGGAAAEAGSLAAGMSELAIAGRQPGRHVPVYAAVSGSNPDGVVGAGGMMATAPGQPYGVYNQPAAMVEAWVDNFSKVLLAGLSTAQHTHEPIRELAYLLVLALAHHHGDLFEPVLDVVLQPLLQGCADSSREVLMAAQQALDVLMASMPPLRCMDILSHKLPSDAAISSGTAVEGDVLCATIRCLQLVCRQMPQADLLAVAPAQLLPGLFAAFQHSRPDVRKAVVFCLVDMWHAAGNGLTPYLASLSTSQLKLLTIYYNRTQHKQQQPLLMMDGQ